MRRLRRARSLLHRESLGDRPRFVTSGPGGAASLPGSTSTRLQESLQPTRLRLFDLTGSGIAKESGGEESVNGRVGPAGMSGRNEDKQSVAAAGE